jgi:hypothetical protein
MADYRVDYDAPANIIRVKLDGFLSFAQVEEFCHKLIDMACSVRKRGSNVLVLFDCTETAVQTPEAVEKMKDTGLRIRQPGDKHATLVTSNLVKMQANRNFSSDHEKAFLSLHAAETWLKTDTI